MCAGLVLDKIHQCTRDTNERSCYTRRVGKGDETRTAILDIGAAAAASAGLRGLTIGSLAAASGLSKSGLFAHFGSKEGLQLAVLDHARTSFVDEVMRPSLKAARGEPRLREVFSRWVSWEDRPGGCPFIAAASEMDDEPGPVRDRLVRDEIDFLDSLAQMARGGVGEGHFRPDLDPDQLAFELHGVMMAYHHSHRLMRNPMAAARAERAIDRLLDAARPSTT